MKFFKTDEEVELMQISAMLVSDTIAELAKVLKPGITTLSLDKLADDYINDHGGVASFHNYEGYPFHICTSINEVIVHGLPSQRALAEGDVLSIDIGVLKNAFHGDHAYTFIIGETTQDVLDLVRVTKEALFLGIDEAYAGNYVGDISSAIQRYAEGLKYGVVRDLVGHGIGRAMHEEPQVANFGRRSTGMEMRENLTLAIEPMVTLGSREIIEPKEGWNIRTADGSIAAHFEHNVCVKPEKAQLLSDFGPIQAAEKANSNLNSSYYEL